MKKLLLSLGIIGIFGIVSTTNNLNLFDSHKTVEDNISNKKKKKLTSSEKEKISQETNLENSCCTKILNK